MRYFPDVLGVQETTKSWNDSKLITEWLPKNGYTVINDAGELINYTLLAVRSDSFEILESGYERLVSTEDKSKSIQWTALKDKKTSAIYGVCNAHFEYRVGEQYDLARESNANQICDSMDDIKDKYNCEF